VTVSFLEHVKVGIPVTIALLAIAIIWTMKLLKITAAD